MTPSSGNALNEVLAMEFLHDQLATGTKVRVPTVVDTFSRFSPMLDARVAAGERMWSRRSTCLLDHRHPATIRVDQGSEIVACYLDIWAYAQGIVPVDDDPIVTLPAVAARTVRRSRRPPGQRRHTRQRDSEGAMPSIGVLLPAPGQ